MKYRQSAGGIFYLFRMIMRRFFWFRRGSFCELHKRIFHTYMKLEAYHFPVLKRIGFVKAGRNEDIKFDLRP
ncbi:hypothetical protein D3C76_203490 [compost metagenome]